MTNKDNVPRSSVDDLDRRVLRFLNPVGEGAGQVEGALELAHDLVEAGRCEEALDVTSMALEKCPNDGQLLIIAARAWLGRGDLIWAQLLLIDAVQALPKSPEPLRWLAELLLKRGMPERASRVARMAIGFDADDPQLVPLLERAERLTDVVREAGGEDSDGPAEDGDGRWTVNPPVADGVVAGAADDMVAGAADDMADDMADDDDLRVDRLIEHAEAQLGAGDPEADDPLHAAFDAVVTAPLPAADRDASGDERPELTREATKPFGPGMGGEVELVSQARVIGTVALRKIEVPAGSKGDTLVPAAPAPLAAMPEAAVAPPAAPEGAAPPPVSGAFHRGATPVAIPFPLEAVDVGVSAAQAGGDSQAADVRNSQVGGDHGLEAEDALDSRDGDADDPAPRESPRGLPSLRLSRPFADEESTRHAPAPEAEPDHPSTVELPAEPTRLWDPQRGARLLSGLLDGARRRVPDDQDDGSQRAVPGSGPQAIADAEGQGGETIADAGGSGDDQPGDQDGGWPQHDTWPGVGELARRRLPEGSVVDGASAARESSAPFIPARAKEQPVSGGAFEEPTVELPRIWPPDPSVARKRERSTISYDAAESSSTTPVVAAPPIVDGAMPSIIVADALLEEAGEQDVLAIENELDALVDTAIDDRRPEPPEATVPRPVARVSPAPPRPIVHRGDPSVRSIYAVPPPDELSPRVVDDGPPSLRPGAVTAVRTPAPPSGGRVFAPDFWARGTAWDADLIEDEETTDVQTEPTRPVDTSGSESAASKPKRTGNRRWRRVAARLTFAASLAALFAVGYLGFRSWARWNVGGADAVAGLADGVAGSDVPVESVARAEVEPDGASPPPPAAAAQPAAAPVATAVPSAAEPAAAVMGADAVAITDLVSVIGSFLAQAPGATERLRAAVASAEASQEADLARVMLLCSDGDRGAPGRLVAMASADDFPAVLLAQVSAAALRFADAKTLRQIEGLLTTRVWSGDPASEALSVLRLRVKARTGEVAVALVDARASAAADPEDSGKAAALAEVALSAGDPASALAALESLPAAESAGADALLLRGRAHALSGSLSAATADLTRAVAVSPLRADARLALARHWASLGRIDDAEPLWEALADERELWRGERISILARVDRAEALIARGDLAAAEPILAALEREAGGSPAFRRAAARSALARGHGRQALLRIAQSGADDDADIDSVVVYGDALYATGAVDPAHEQYRRALARDPGHPAALMGRAEVYLRAALIDQAERYCEKATEAAALRPGSTATTARLRFIEARVLLERGRRAEAERAVRDAIEGGLDGPDVYFALGESLAGRDAVGAREAYERYLAADPDGRYAERVRRALNPR